MESAVEQGFVKASATKNGDVLVRDYPYTALSKDGFSALANVAQERRWALAWMVGEADWDEVDTST